MLKLYCAPHTVSSTVVITLNEGVHWEPIRVDVAGGEQTREDFLALNPKGRVPVLVTPEGLLTETGAILEYLGETVLPALLPIDPLQRARMREIMYFIGTTMHVNHAHMLRGYRWATTEASFADMAAKVPENMATSAAYIEGLMVGPYMFGDDLTLVDPYLYSVTRWLKKDGVDIADFPKLEAFKAKMETRASVQKTTADGFFG